uniref:LINE-1 reverse transcriptase isogeny n=1 Tax=Cajanus cajan TaxID=3821 RepID=A0A151RGQ9_CAJCA|nr:LINE-1 reverse transcriptase isogeny [Cajanus cajan]
MKGEVCKYIEEFHANGKIPKGCNSSFIALIPKVDQPSNLGEYRPISLVGSMYKILAKLLSNRLKVVLPSVIYQTQSAFIGNRNLLHSILVANETIDDAKRSKNKCFVLKVDYEKAFDSVNWDFLLYMLQRLGFCNQWRRWIEECMKTGHVSVLVNGSPTQEFPLQRGIRQGDPLAPFLYVIVAEGLAGLMRSAIRNNLYSSYCTRNNRVEVNLLQFADDTIFFGEASLSNVITIKAILRCFELVSGLKVNFHESRCGAIGTDQHVLVRFATLLNCKIMDMPFNYLELPIGANPRKLATWNPVIQKFKKKACTLEK